MDKKSINEMRGFMDDVISAEKSAGSVIDKKEAELELKEQLFKELLLVNKQMILFKFYDELLMALYASVNEVRDIKEFEHFSFDIYIKRDGENVFVRAVSDKEYNPKINSEFVISRDAYKGDIFNVELPEDEDICKFYLGDNIHWEFKNILMNILKSEEVSISPNEKKYIVGAGLNKSVRELKDYIINQMEYCEHWAIDGYEQLEREEKQKEKNRKKLEKTKSNGNSVNL